MNTDTELFAVELRTSLDLEGLHSGLEPAAVLARSRRSARRRTAGMTLGGVVAVSAAVLMLAPTVVGLPGGGTGSQPAGEGSRLVAPGTVPTCGEAVTAATLPGTVALRTTERTLPSDGPGLVAYDVELVNGTSETLKGVLSPVESVVSRDGVVVASFIGGRLVGRTLDLAPGNAITLEGTLSLLDCTAPDATANGTGKTPMDIPRVSLPPGDYTGYSWVRLIQADGSEIILRSDAWDAVVLG